MTTAVKIDGRVTASVKREADKYFSQATALVIVDDASNLAAGELLGKVKAAGKSLKETKNSILDPLKVSMKNVKDLFKTPEEQLAAAETLLKQALLDYYDKKEAEAQKQADYVERRLDKGTMRTDTAMAKLATIDQADSTVGGGQIKYSPEKVRITDVLQLITENPALLEREAVIEVLRKEIAKDIKGGAPLPGGAELYREKLVAGIAG